jgi:hypothetical protein
LPENCSDTGERRLPVTKKSVERKDGGVVACQPEPEGELKKDSIAGENYILARNN